jgi:DNA-binding transcriptional LysR family regulator
MDLDPKSLKLFVSVVEQGAIADALDFDCVGLHTGSAINLQLARGSLDAVRPLRLHALSRMVEAGLGIGKMPARVAVQYAASLRIHAVALEDSWSRRELSLCVRAYDTPSPTARLLADSLRVHQN